MARLKVSGGRMRRTVWLAWFFQIPVANHQQIVPTRCRDFELPLGRGLAAHFAEIWKGLIDQESSGASRTGRLKPVRLNSSTRPPPKDAATRICEHLP
jgi:hypothetical protein